MMLRYLIEKEFKQLKRNSFLPRLILLFPCMMMLVMPWAATLEIENLRIAVIDNDRSPSSERLVHRIEASRYFQLTALPPSYAQGLQAIETDQADMLLEIPCGFEKAQANGQSPAALIAVNTVNGTKGGLFTPHQQHAGMGTRHHLPQSVTLLYGNHAHGLPEGKRHLRYRLPTFRTFVLCLSALCMGHTQLPQTAISPNAPAILPRHVRVEVFTPRNFFKNALFGGKNCKSIISTTQNYSVTLPESLYIGTILI